MRATDELAEYSESNVPLMTPKQSLPSISSKGSGRGRLRDGYGISGRTERYQTQSEVEQRMNAVKQDVNMRSGRDEELRKYMEASDKTRIQYANKFAGSSKRLEKLDRYEPDSHRH